MKRFGILFLLGILVLSNNGPDFQQSALHEPASQTCGGDALGQVPNNVYGYGRIDALAAFSFQQNFTNLFKSFLPVIRSNY